MNKYISPTLLHFFKNIIAESVYHGETIFDKRILPLRQSFLIFGREGSGKYTTLKYLLEQESIGFVDFTLPKYNNLFNFVQSLKRAQDILSKKPDIPQVIVINDIQYIFNNENLDFKEDLLFLKKYVLNTQNLIIAISNRYPTENTGFEKDFYSQFDQRSFIESPSVNHVKDFYKDKIFEYFNFIKDKREIHVENNFTEYDWLAECSGYCTFKEIHDFLKRIFYDITHLNKAAIEFNKEFINGYMFQTQGVPNIVPFDTITIENMFRNSGNRGPISRPTKRQRVEPTIFIEPKYR